MRSPISDIVAKYIEANINREFYDKKIVRLRSLKLCALLQYKNPYLIRVGGLISVNAFIEKAVDVHLDAYDESVFGKFLKNVAGFTCKTAFGGKKSKLSGVDVECCIGDRYYLLSISGRPYVNDAIPVQETINKFVAAKGEISKAINIDKNQIIAIDGYCFGNSNDVIAGNCFKLSGEHFWRLISGREEVYQEILLPLTDVSEARGKTFRVERARQVNKLTLEFLKRFSSGGLVSRNKLLQYCSGSRGRIDLADKSLQTA